MGDMGLGLSYWLPCTEFEAEVTSRKIIRTDQSGTRLVTVADAVIATAVAGDSNSRHTLSVEAGLLEKISLVINLDDRGFIQSVNSESGHDLVPVLSVLGKAVGLATAIVLAGFVPLDRSGREEPLEALWADRHPELAKLASRLAERIPALLNRMTQDHTPALEVVETGAAVEALQTQLALISQAKRSWIVAQSDGECAKSWRFRPNDLLQIDSEHLPNSLESPNIPSGVSEMAEDFGVLVAISDRRRRAVQRFDNTNLVDTIALRRSRPVEVGVYIRETENIWALDRESARALDVVDEFSPTDYLSIDGSWWKTKKFELSYHADMSLKSFGVTSSSNVSSVATSFGDVLGALTEARKGLATKPSAADKQLSAAKSQLDLLKTASEFEILSATKERAGELAALEQQKKLREAST